MCIRDRRRVESTASKRFWKEYRSKLPNKFASDFEVRFGKFYGINYAATVPTNSLLNLGYSVVASNSLKAINTKGLEPSVGFLHDLHRSKMPLVYDVQETARHIAEEAVLRLAGDLGRSDFYRASDFSVRLKDEPATRLVSEVESRLHEGGDFLEGRDHALSVML